MSVLNIRDMTNKEYMVNIGQRIKEIMREQGFTAKALSDKIDKSPQYVSNVLNGNQGATFEVLELFSNALGVKMWELFASRDEIVGQSPLSAPTCPYCGKPLSIEIK